ncbi:hypothetical protein TNCV_919711 [Trichonephila clavipes]|nr:hypothetical protein TNCV_919711 [Trichonephila clavipes]
MGRKYEAAVVTVNILRLPGKNHLFSHGSVTTASLNTYNVYQAIGAQRARGNRLEAPPARELIREPVWPLQRLRQMIVCPRSTADSELWRPDLRKLTEAPRVIKKARLNPRIKAHSELENLCVREPIWRPLPLKTCDTAIP